MAAVAEDGRRTLLSIRGPGDLVGERALFRGPGTKYGLGARSLTDVHAWPVPQDRFRQILARHPQGWAVLASALQARLDAAEDRISLMAGASASQRLAVFILQLLPLRTPADSRYPRAMGVPLTQAELGEWIGATRETVERVLSRWVQRGAVRARFVPSGGISWSSTSPTWKESPASNSRCRRERRRSAGAGAPQVLPPSLFAESHPDAGFCGSWPCPEGLTGLGTKDAPKRP